MNTRLARFVTRAARRLAAATSYLLKLLVIAYMIAPGAPRSGSEEVVFQLPLDRASHAFSIRQWSPADNAFIDTPLTNLQLTHLADDGTGQMTVQTADSFLEAMGTISLLEDFLLMDDSTGETGPPNLFGTPSFQRTSFLDTPWFPAGTAASSFFMTLPESRHGHVFTLFTQGVSYGLSTGPLLGYRSTDESGQPMVVPYGFFEGWTGTAPGGPYFLVDHTLGEQTDTRPASNRDFVSDTTWSAMSGQVPTRLVTLWVPDADAMNQFALHTAAGSVEWNYPSQGEGFDDSGAWHTGWRISGAIGVNQDFWLVREVDGATATGTMGIENLALDWTAAFAPYEPPPPPDEPPYEPNWQTVTIQVGENHWSETILITMDDVSVVYPTADWSNQGYQAAYDMYGQEYYRYNYVPFTATIDVNLGYFVSDASGHTDLMDGYDPPLPPLPPTPPSYQTITFPVGENHWTHPITVQMDDGSTVVAEPDWSTQAYQTAVDAWGNVYYTYAHVSYFASVDINQGYFIVDSEGHTDFMDGFNPPPPPDYQTVSIPVGENHWGHPIQITLGNGSVVIPEPAWNTQGWQTAFDANGVDYYHYNYVNYVATFDVSQGYTVSDGEGHTDLMDGFNPPPPPGIQIVPPGTNLVNVQVGENHWGHIIRFHLSDGTTVDGSPDWSMSGSVSVVDASGSGFLYNFVYYTATIDSSLSVVSIDDGEGHTDFMDGAHPPEPPPQEEPLYLQIAASRWDHAFEVRTSDGGVYPVGADQMQGFWTADQTSQSWWTSYYYFNATSTTRTGINWWVVDLTTGETADPNANDLSTWVALDAELDTDSDGLKDWYERLIGTNPNDPNTDGDNMNDGAELTVSRNPRVPDDPLPADRDGDGILDRDEDINGNGVVDLNETDPNNPDSDGDGIFDSAERKAGSNPLAKDSDDDGIDDLDDRDPNDDALNTPLDMLTYAVFYARDTEGAVISAPEFGGFKYRIGDDGKFAAVSGDRVISWEDGVAVNDSTLSAGMLVNDVSPDGTVCGAYSGGWMSGGVYTSPAFSFRHGTTENILPPFNTIDGGEADDTAASKGSGAFTIGKNNNIHGWHSIGTVQYHYREHAYIAGGGGWLSPPIQNWSDPDVESWGTNVSRTSGTGSTFVYLRSGWVPFTTQDEDGNDIEDRRWEILDRHLWKGAQVTPEMVPLAPPASIAVNSLIFNDDGQAIGNLLSSANPTSKDEFGFPKAFLWKHGELSFQDLQTLIPEQQRKRFRKLQPYFITNRNPQDDIVSVFFRGQHCSISPKHPDANTKWADGYFVLDLRREAAPASGLEGVRVRKLRISGPIDPGAIKDFSASGLALGEGNLDPVPEGVPAWQIPNKLLVFMPVEFVSFHDDPLVEKNPAKPPPSLPSPTVTIGSFNVDELERVNDSTIHGRLTFSGIVSSELCDTIPGDDGKINELWVYVNGAPEPERTVALQVTKGRDEASYTKPFPYSGVAANVVLEDIPLSDGDNIIRFAAADKLYGNPGYTEYVVTVHAAANVALTQVWQGGVSLAAATSDVAGLRHASFNYEPETGTTLSVPMVESAPFSGEFSGASGGVTIALSAGSAHLPVASQIVAATITDATRGGHAMLMTLGQAGAVEGQFNGVVSAFFDSNGMPVGASADDSDDDQSLDPPPAPLVETISAGWYQKKRTSSRDFHPVGIAVRAPPGWASRLAIKLNGESFPFMTGDLGNLYLRWPAHQTPVLLNWVPKRESAVADNLLLGTVNQAFTRQGLTESYHFLGGFIVGFGAGGYHLVADLTHFIQGSVKYVNNTVVALGIGIAISVEEASGVDSRADVMLWEATMEKNKEANVAIGEMGRFVWEINELARASQGQFNALIFGLLTGDMQVANGSLLYFSDMHQLMFEMSAEVLRNLAEDFPADSYEQGYWMGRAIFEIASLFLAPEIKGAELAKLTKLEFLQKLKALPFFSTEYGANAMSKTAALEERLNKVVAQAAAINEPGCFAAGTPIRAAAGFVAVEKVRANDWVWARDPHSNGEGWKQVVTTMITHPDALVHVRYSALGRHAKKTGDSGDDGADCGATGEIACTFEHPFAVVEVEGGWRWVAAAELRHGDRLRLARGGEAVVTGMRFEVAEQGASFTTYNFEVADWHTYFAGAHEIWVHNSCRALQVSDAALTEFRKWRIALPEEEKLNHFADLRSAGQKVLNDPRYGDLEKSVVARVHSEEILIEQSDLLGEELAKPTPDIARLQHILNHHPVYQHPEIGWNGGFFQTLAKTKAGTTEIHHIVPDALVKRLRIIDPQRFGSLDTNLIPSHAWRKEMHRAFHDGGNGSPGLTPAILGRLSEYQGASGVQALADDLVTFYANSGQPEMATIAEAWFRIKGVIPLRRP